MRGDKRTSLKSEGKGTVRGHKRGVAGYSRKTALLEEAITQMNAGKYGRSSSALKELLALDPQNMEARRLFATLHLRLGSLIPARQAFDTLITEAFQRQDYWLAESLLREYLAAGPRCVPFLEKLGVIYQEKGDVQEAIAEYGKAIDILIEDPDPDNPHLVSQLYQKVRELAPASPIAIRLAAFFDAQTGELIARGTGPSAPATEPLDTSSDHQAIPEPASGVMPWDIDTAQGDRHASGETISQPDGSSGFAPTQDHEALSEAVAAQGQREPRGEVPIPVQSARSVGESTPAQSPEVIQQATDYEEPLVEEEHRASVSPSDAQVAVLSSDLIAEAQSVSAEPAASGAENRPTVDQGVVALTQQPTEAELVCTIESSAVQQTTNDQSSAASELTAVTQETASAAAIQSQVASTPLLEAVSTVPDSAAGAHTETVRDMPASRGSGQVSRPASAEPWKEPGFSWENLFDRAWNFGTLPSSDSVSQEATRSESGVSPVSSDSSVQLSSPIESESVQIPERVENTALMEEATSTGSVRPLPWDQVQESALPIPPAEIEESPGGSVATTAEQSVATAQDMSQAEHESVEISERAARDVVAMELTAAASVSPLPWDQVQESSLPIPPTSAEESPAESLAIAEGQLGSTGEDRPPIESAAVQIPARTDHDAITPELTDTGSVRPMPWDQVQESSLPIPPTSAEESPAESLAIIEGPLGSVGEDRSPIESATVEIPARTDHDAIAPELTDTGSVRPMPWDQIQESALPIPPAEVKEFDGEGIPITEEQASPIVEEKPQVESVAVESPESADRAIVGEELTVTDPITPLLRDQLLESPLPIPTAPIEELQAGETITTEERATSPVGEGEVVDVEQAQSLTSEALAPPSEETESLSEMTSSGLSLSSESDAPPVQVHASQPEVPRSEISPAVPLMASGFDEAHLRSGEAGSTMPAALAQADDVDQRLAFRLHDAQDAEREPAVPQPPDIREGVAGPINEPEQPLALLPSGTGGLAPVEGLGVVPFSLGVERGGEREEGAVVPQDVPTKEAAAASSPSPESPPAVPQWRMQEPVTVPPAEREVIAVTPVETFSSSSSTEMAAIVQGHDDLRQDDLVLAESGHKSSESVVPQEEWAKTSESIRFVEEPPEVSAVTAESEQASVAPVVGMVADDTRFMSSRNVRRDASREQEVESPSRSKVRSESRGIGVAIQDFIGSCFSTTRAIVATCVGLVLLSVIAVAAGIGMVGLIWLSMEEGPSPAYQSFTTIPQQTLSDVKKNGYFLLVGFDASAQLDPIQAGYEGKIGTDQVASGLACLGDTQGASGQQPNASASVSKSWFRSADPIGQFKSHADTVRGWASQQSSALSRYGRWHTLPFEDWGYGRTGRLPCASIVFAHELYLADGFLQAMEEGVERLEIDMEAWRIVLGQARTLPVKALALQAMNDDIAVASGLLIRSDFEGKYLGRISKMLRPLDQAELSIRWPMQSELVVASNTYEAQVKAAKANDQSVYAVIASTLSLPKQRRLNDYAEYYEASYKAVGEGQHSTLPKWKDYIHTPAAGLSDYLANPIENIIGLEPLPPWELYHGQVMDTEARLRLASLQAWLRRGPTDGDVLTRLAKAGQKFYDPYTGLPMLVNMKKAALYSVGHDGKDQDADPQFDVVVTIPAVQASASHPSSKLSAESSKP